MPCIGHNSVSDANFLFVDYPPRAEGRRTLPRPMRVLDNKRERSCKLAMLNTVRFGPDKRVATKEVTSILDAWKNVAGYSFDFVSDGIKERRFRRF